jgi:hypothetical protein
MPYKIDQTIELAMAGGLYAASRSLLLWQGTGDHIQRGLEPRDQREVSSSYGLPEGVIGHGPAVGDQNL